MGAPGLTVELLSLILQHVPQQNRLSSCALVSRNWHAAAVAATTTISAQLADPSQIEMLDVWLWKHGSHTTALSLAGTRPNFLQLDTSIALRLEQLLQLQNLRIIRAKVATDSALGNASNSFGSLKALTSLYLEHVYMSLHCMSSLKQLSGLQRLHLIAVYEASNSRDTVMLNACIRHTVSDLTALTALCLELFHLDDSVVSGISGLSLLQHLEVKSAAVTADVVNMLPLGLTHLQLSIGESLFTPHKTPNLSLLTGLRHLQLESFSYRNADFDISVLHGLVQLQRLILRCPLSFPPNTAESSLALVSSSLTFLDLTECRLPANTVQHLFPSERQWPALRVLHLGSSCGYYRTGFPSDPPHFEDGDMGRLAVSCPGLLELRLKNALHAEHLQQLSSLAQLTALSKLALSGRPVVSDASIQLLVELQLTSLRDLDVDGEASFKNSFTAHGIVLLRKLTQLTRLRVVSHLERYDWWGVSNGDPQCIELTSQVNPPDVWQQLGHAFNSDTIVAGAFLQGNVEECQEAANRAKSAEEQVKALKQQTYYLQKQVQSFKQHMQTAHERIQYLSRSGEGDYWEPSYSVRG